MMCGPHLQGLVRGATVSFGCPRSPWHTFSFCCVQHFAAMTEYVSSKMTAVFYSVIGLTLISYKRFQYDILSDTLGPPLLLTSTLGCSVRTV